MANGLERRQNKLDALFDRAPISEFPDNTSNVIHDLNIREVIKTDPYIYKLWKCRTSLVRNEPIIYVPPNTVEFFREYALGIGSGTIVEPGTTFELEPPFPNGNRHTCLMYSGGVESQFLAVTYSSVSMLRMHNFFPHTSITREFQLALAGMAFGFETTLIGCALLSEISHNKRQYEFTPQFVDLWNDAFWPYTIQYPVGWGPTKDVLIEFLLKSNCSFTSCESLKDGKECGKCWHCAEKYFCIMALRTREENKDIPLPYMDIDFLHKVQKSNRWNLGQKVDKFSTTTDLFRTLERKYGVTSWYKGDPTKPHA